METTADKIRAFAFAIGLHVLCLLLMLGGVWWTRSAAPEPAAGPIIDAVLVDNTGISWAPMPMPEAPEPQPEAPPPPAPQPEPEPPAAPPPQPVPEPRPQDAPEPPQPEPQTPPPVPDTRDQERIEQQQQAEAAEQRRQEQEARRRQEQIDLTERQQREQEEAERRERLAREQREIEERLAEVRRQREAAERQTQMETERLQQIADRERPAATPAPEPQQGTQRAGQGGTDESQLAAYRVAIQRAIERHWRRPESIAPGTVCRLHIRQIPGGEVIGVEIGRECPFDEFGRRSVENAVLQAQPLPYTGFESVFERNLDLRFRAPES